MKKAFILLLLVLLPGFAGAHEVKHTGTFDILLHLEPQDSPIARETGHLYFNVTDSAEKFSFPDCDCRVAIASASSTLLDRKLTAEDEAPDWGVNVSTVDFVFPSLGIYQVTLEGKSKTNLYQPFKLVYDVRIERESSAQPADLGQSSNTSEESQLSLTNYYLIGGGIIIFGIIIYEVLNKKRKKN